MRGAISYLQKREIEGELQYNEVSCCAELYLAGAEKGGREVCSG